MGFGEGSRWDVLSALTLSCTIQVFQHNLVGRCFKQCLGPSFTSDTAAIQPPKHNTMSEVGKSSHLDLCTGKNLGRVTIRNKSCMEWISSLPLCPWSQASSSPTFSWMMVNTLLQISKEKSFFSYLLQNWLCSLFFTSWPQSLAGCWLTLSDLPCRLLPSGTNLLRGSSELKVQQLNSENR